MTPKLGFLEKRGIGNFGGDGDTTTFPTPLSKI